MSFAIFPVTYLPPVSHFALIQNYREIQWDIQEHYQKQFLYNRCNIYGPNGLQKLIIPIRKNTAARAEARQDRTALKDIEICYDSPWQKNHWRSLEAAYRRSPYFELYEAGLVDLYMGDYRPAKLVDWNIKLFGTVCLLMGIKLNTSFTSAYLKSYTEITDHRRLASPSAGTGVSLKKYHQVFEEKYGFLENLSIIDLLFCEGPHSKEYLKAQESGAN